jgi:hypothetical protein
MILRHCKLIAEGPIDLYASERSFNLARIFDPIRPCSLMSVGTGASGAGGGGGPTPALDFIVYVNKGGNDATGDGTDEKPFLTWARAFAVLKPLVGPTQSGLALGGPGTYAENLIIPAFVYAAGMNASGLDVTVGTGVGPSVTIDPNWLTAASGAAGGLLSMSTVGDVTVDFTGALGFCQFQSGNSIFVGGHIAITGDPTNGGNFFLAFGYGSASSLTITGCNFFSQCTPVVLGSTLTLKSTATQSVSWNSLGDVLSVAAIDLDATAGQNVTAIVSSQVNSGSLALHDGGGGVTAYIGTATAIPTNVVQTGGAAYPQRKTGPNAIAAGAPGQVITTVGGIAVWAAAGGGVAWADDLAGSTNADQWVAAISGSGGAGGAVPLGTNVQITAFAGGHSSIDLTAANAAFGFINANSFHSDLYDSLGAAPLIIGSSATRIDFLSSPSFRMMSQAAYTGFGTSLQVGALALSPDTGGGHGVLAIELAFVNPTTAPGQTAVIWEGASQDGLHHAGPSGGPFFDEMLAPTWSNVAAHSQQAKRVKFGAFAQTVGLGPVNVAFAIPIPVADTMANIHYELCGKVTVAGGGAQVGDVQAMSVYACYKNVAGVLAPPTTHTAGIAEEQYDASMDPAVVGIVTSPISGTNIQFALTGVAAATIDWTLEVDVLYN